MSESADGSGQKMEVTVRCPSGHEQKVMVEPDGTVTLKRLKCRQCGRELKMLMHRPVK